VPLTVLAVVSTETICRSTTVSVFVVPVPPAVAVIAMPGTTS
jgi:hypothetical protein